MAAGAPLTSVVLAAGSVTDDLGYVALNDVAQALGDIATEYRVIGGHMVTMLAARWNLGAGLFRETRDVDLGMTPILVQDQRVVSRLQDASYVKVAGNRFARELIDIPAGLEGIGRSQNPAAVVDVLVPAYTSRARENVRVGEDLFTSEVPGLQLALARPPVTMALELRRLNGELLQCHVPFADEVSALVLKSLATRVRFKDTDISDIWRCLEIATVAGLRPTDFAGGVRAESVEVIRALFRNRHGAAMTAIADEQRLSVQAADERYTRIRALIARVFGQ